NASFPGGLGQRRGASGLANWRRGADLQERRQDGVPQLSWNHTPESSWEALRKSFGVQSSKNRRTEDGRGTVWLQARSQHDRPGVHPASSSREGLGVRPSNLFGV